MTKKIDFLVPNLDRQKFSGGTWCLMQYALGLAKAGHDVRVVPMMPSPRPTWVPEHAGLSFLVDDQPRSRRLLNAFCDLLRNAGLAIWRRRPAELKTAFVIFATDVFVGIWDALPFEYYRATSLKYLRENARESDVVIATFFETASAATYHPATRKLYFCQHLEPLFYKEMYGKELSRVEAELSYHLGLEVVVNSSWLGQQLEERGVSSVLCCNAINHEYFFPAEQARVTDREIILISYGGRQVDWKGFLEMAQAVALARKSCPELNIRWQVYGDACLPPENDVAPFEALGFLQPALLGNAYRGADILLSASWYESFPLFPLEAMACGLPVIVTQPGTEDFAQHLDTAYVVEPRNPESIARGIIDLATDSILRQRIAESGCKKAEEFTWERSVQRMNTIIGT